MPIRFRCPNCNAKLKAADNAVGRKIPCPICETKVTVPEPIYEAEALPEPEPEVLGAGDVFEDPEDPYGLAEEPSPVAGPLPARTGGGGGAEPAAGGAGLRPCPMCGEMIQSVAAKCRFCGEIFDEGLKKAKAKKKKRKKSYSSDDEDLSGTDLLLAILCPGIGCLAGIIWMIQGKPKGIKTFGISFAAAVIWNIIRFALLGLNEPGGP
jgi:hypothetical protein